MAHDRIRAARRQRIGGWPPRAARRRPLRRGAYDERAQQQPAQRDHETDDLPRKRRGRAIVEQAEHEKRDEHQRHIASPAEQNVP